MSTTTISFKATLQFGQQSLPLVSEAVFGDSDARKGVSNGFLFKLDRAPLAPPVTIYLGELIDFINTRLGGGDLSRNHGMQLISQAFPEMNPGNFNADNKTVVRIHEFSLNSNTSEFLFSFNLDVAGSHPGQGLVCLPETLSSWLQIDGLALSFSATRPTQQR